MPDKVVQILNTKHRDDIVQDIKEELDELITPGGSICPDSSDGRAVGC